MTFDFNGLSVQLERVYSPRLALRPVSLCDAWPLFRATRNPEFNKHLMWHQPADDRQLLDRIDLIVEASRRGRLSALSAVSKDTGEWVALFRFQPYSPDSTVLEMGLWTNDRFWHDGYSVELTRACVDATFTLSSANTLIGAAAPENKPSCRVLERCGLTPAQLVYRQGELLAEVPLQEYSISRAAWAAARQTPEFSRVPMFSPGANFVPAREAEPTMQSE